MGNDIWLLVAAVVVGFVVYTFSRIYQVHQEHRRQALEDMPDGEIKLVQPTVTAAIPAGAFVDAARQIGMAMTGLTKAVSDSTAVFADFAAQLAEYDRVKISSTWTIKHMGIRWYDLWVGAYFKREADDEADTETLTVFLCPLPCWLWVLMRVDQYQIVPRADKRIDPACQLCGERLSAHPVSLDRIGHVTCIGKF
jgi:hypothetical protein